VTVDLAKAAPMNEISIGHMGVRQLLAKRRAKNASELIDAKAMVNNYVSGTFQTLLLHRLKCDFRKTQPRNSG